MSQTILLIDDSSSLRRVFAMVLAKAGYRVLEAVDGRQALAMLESHTVHLIISDINMPTLRGDELVHKLQVHPRLRHIPIAMLTTVVDENLKREMRHAGVKAWITKPFEPTALLDVIARLALPATPSAKS